jgi:hypothetical protein
VDDKVTEIALNWEEKMTGTSVRRFFSSTLKAAENVYFPCLFL